MKYACWILKRISNCKLSQPWSYCLAVTSPVIAKVSASLVEPSGELPSELVSTAVPGCHTRGPDQQLVVLGNLLMGYGIRT
jgi:hypothetical protein